MLLGPGAESENFSRKYTLDYSQKYPLQYILHKIYRFSKILCVFVLHEREGGGASEEEGEKEKEGQVEGGREGLREGGKGREREWERFSDVSALSKYST